MKTKISLILLSLTLVMASCMQSPQGEKAKTGDATSVDFPKDAIELKANLELSKIEWLGTKPSGTHFGTLGIKEGSLFVKNDELLGGYFTLDMNAIEVLDIAPGEMNQKLVGHLKSPDFFSVDSFPTATFKFSTIVPIEKGDMLIEGLNPTHTIEGNLTLRGVTRKVSFPAYINIANGMVEAKTPQFILNRTEWNVNYGSKSIFANLLDNFIHDEMGVTISLTAK